MYVSYISYSAMSKSARERRREKKKYMLRHGKGVCMHILLYVIILYPYRVLPL